MSGLLCIVTMSHEALLCTAFAERCNGCLLPSSGNAIHIPEPFLSAYKFPFSVQPIKVLDMLSAGDAAVQHTADLELGVTSAEASLQASAMQRDGGAQSAGAPDHQQLHQHIRQAVQQQRLMQLAGHDATAARQLLDNPPPSLELDSSVMHATAANLQSLDPSIQVEALLKAVATANSHADCTVALLSLQRVGSNSRGLRALSKADWAGAFDRLLRAAPVTVEDQALWLQVLALLDRMLSATPLTQVQETEQPPQQMLTPALTCTVWVCYILQCNDS